MLLLAVASKGGFAGFVSCGASECWAVAFGVCFNHPVWQQLPELNFTPKASTGACSSHHEHDSCLIVCLILSNHRLTRGLTQIDTFATLPLIEDRMLRRPERAELYRAYQCRTSLLIPLWPGAVSSEGKKEA